MKTPKEYIADEITRSLGVLEMTLADFSDAEMLKRPVPGANHAAWQLGHLAVADASMAKALGATGVEVPAGWEAKFTKDTAKSDDAAAFPGKAEMLALMKAAREAAARRVREMTDEELNRPGPERMRAMFPTLGHFALLLSNHAAMHVGQFQVIRRALGKPVLF